MLQLLSKTNPDLTKELMEWYINKYNKILPVNSFIQLSKDSNSHVIGVILEFINSKNIGILCATFNASIFYIDMRLNANNIIKNYNETGKVTDVVEFLQFDKPFKSIRDCEIYVINYIFDKILVPF